MEGRMQPTVAPPLDPAELGEALREFGQSRTLPRVAYTSERVLAFELERLFAGSWVCVARAEDLPDPGDRLAVQVGDVGVLVVRDRDATLRAFANVCRHRGHELLPAGASASARSRWRAMNTCRAPTGRCSARITTSATTAPGSIPSCAASARRAAAATTTCPAPGWAARWTCASRPPPCRWTVAAPASPSKGSTQAGCAPSSTCTCCRTCCSACTPTT